MPGFRSGRSVRIRAAYPEEEDPMKFDIYKDEWYPVFGLMEGESYEVDDALVERFRSAEAEYEAVQAELKAIYGGSL